MNESLSKTLRELRLGGMAESLEVRLAEAIASKLTYLEFLELVLADEMLVRNDRKIERGVRRAGFRDVRRLEDFDFSFNRSIFDVVRDFLHDEAMGGEEKVLARYLKPDLLIIDDMGMKQLPKRSGEYLFEIIMRRHEVRSTMMTTNRPLEDWGKLIGDVPSASAILDRFLQSAEIMKLTGRSYRMKNAEKSSKGAKAPPGSAAETDQ